MRENLNRSETFALWRKHMDRVRRNAPGFGFIITSHWLPLAFSHWGGASETEDNDNERA